MLRMPTTIKTTLYILSCIALLTVHHSTQAIKPYVGVSMYDSVIPPWLDAYGDDKNITLYVCFSRYSCVKNGDIYYANETKFAPFVTIVGSDVKKEDKYIYMLLDVDEYTTEKPLAKSSLHWLISDIPGTTKSYEHVADTGKVKVPYRRAHKPYFYEGDIGLHKYYSLLYKQNKANQDIEDITWFERFDVREFAATYKLGYPTTGLVHQVDYTEDT